MRVLCGALPLCGICAVKCFGHFLCGESRPGIGALPQRLATAFVWLAGVQTADALTDRPGPSGRLASVPGDTDVRRDVVILLEIVNVDVEMPAAGLSPGSLTGGHVGQALTTADWQGCTPMAWASGCHALSPSR